VGHSILFLTVADVRADERPGPEPFAATHNYEDAIPRLNSLYLLASKPLAVFT
jgi:hypothetical protein